MSGAKFVDVERRMGQVATTTARAWGKKVVFFIGWSASEV